MARQLMTQAGTMSKALLEVDRMSEKVLSRRPKRFVDDCDRVISHISPKIMQTKRGCIINILVRLTRW